MCRYHSNIVKKQLFTIIRRLQIKHEKNMPVLSSYAGFKRKTATYVPRKYTKKSPAPRDKCRTLKNCDTGHSKNILNTCQDMRVNPHNLPKSTFKFKHKPLLSSYAGFIHKIATNVPLKQTKKSQPERDICYCQL